MADFDQIERHGGQIKFDRGNTVGFSGQTSTPLAISQFSAAHDGTVLDWVPTRGISLVSPQPPISVLMISDKHGMFGRRCPACSCYFRMRGTARFMQCPYCLHRAHCKDFMTSNQNDYVKAYCVTMLEAVKTGTEINVDLYQLAEMHAINTSPWTYKEESQQNSYTCVRCKILFDILGEYGSCPSCGHGNWREVWERKMDNLDNRFMEADAAIKDRAEREAEWTRLLTSSIADFEAMARNVKKSLEQLPTTPRRKKSFANMSFQRIDQASRQLSDIYDIDIFDGLTADDQDFLTRMFQQRHLFTHTGGVVDQDYIDNTRDTTVRLNQKLRPRSNQMHRLLKIVRGIGLRLVDGYESIS